MDRWQTKQFLLEGGLILNEDVLAQGTNKPGSLIKAVNFEVGLEGGYRRISGYAKFDPDPVPGTGNVFGVAIFADSVIAARGAGIYRSTGAGWTAISTDTRAGTGRYRHTIYNWAAPTITLVNGAGQPVKYSGGVYTVLATAPASASHVAEYKRHLFFGKNSSVIFSAPADDTNYTPGAGAGEINVGFVIVGMQTWRDALIVFGKNSIKRITGSNATDFVLENITSDLGCAASDSIQELGGDLVYLSQDGIRTVAATEKIGDLELGTLSKPIQARTSALLKTVGGDNLVSTVVRGKSQYRLLSGNPAIDPAAAEGVLGCIRGSLEGNAGWEWFDLIGFNATCAHSALFADSELVIHGGSDGYVYRQDFGDSLDGLPIAAYLQTPYLPLEDPNIRKTLYKLSAYLALEGGAAFRVNTLFDYDDLGSIQPPGVDFSGFGNGLVTYDSTNVYDGIGVYDSNPYPVFFTNLVGSGFAVSFVFSSYDILPAYALRALAVQYSLGGRR